MSEREKDWAEIAHWRDRAEQAEQRAREWEIVAGHLEAKLIDVQELLRALEGALKHYADHDAWKEVETTFAYAPHEWAFDWDGDLGDHPWSIAEATLPPPPAEEEAGNG